MLTTIIKWVYSLFPKTEEELLLEEIMKLSSMNKDERDSHYYIQLANLELKLSNGYAIKFANTSRSVDAYMRDAYYNLYKTHYDKIFELKNKI